MELMKQIASQFGNNPFTYQDLKKLGVKQSQIIILLKDQKIQRLNRGVYLISGSNLSDTEQFRATVLRVGNPSAICLVSALSHYGVIDEIPKKVWVLVPESKHTAHKDIRPLRSRNPRWKVGIIEEEGYKITSLERSIVDALTLRSIVGNLGVQAIKTALKQKKTTVSKILEMAKSLKVEHRVYGSLEAFI